MRVVRFKRALFRGHPTVHGVNPDMIEANDAMRRHFPVPHYLATHRKGPTQRDTH
jgi:hypothetical protein